MAMTQFSIRDDLILTELYSGMQLKLGSDEDADEGLSWIEGWFELPNGNSVLQRFIVLQTGQPTYQLVNEAVAFWGKQVLEAQLSSVQMSPEFSNQYLLNALKQLYRSRWN